MEQNRIIPTPAKNICEHDQVAFHAVHIKRDYKMNDPHIDDAHIHPFYEIYVNLSGNVSFLYHQTLIKIQSGDIVLSYPGAFHHCMYHEPGVHDHYCIWFQTEDGALLDYLKSHMTEGLNRLDISMHEELFGQLQKLSRLSNVENKQFEKTLAFYNLIKLISHSEVSPSAHDKPDFPEKFHEMLDYINNHFTTINDVKEIAATAHISVATMNRMFRRYLQLSPHQLLTSKKMSYAEKLLLSDHTVTECCFLAGFSDCSHFISAFKKVYGQTPYQYKKQLNA